MKSSTSDTAEGKMHQVKGKIKEIAGKVTMNPDLEAEGNAENLDGNVQEKIGKVQEGRGEIKRRIMRRHAFEAVSTAASNTHTIMPQWHGGFGVKRSERR